ncbi:hypothetical protein NQZ68_017135 [Dissostichus eleginoides]|nr:hypothetical protein NQZ68_017135 [Dissostichus eleginoides]
MFVMVMNQFISAPTARGLSSVIGGSRSESRCVVTLGCGSHEGWRLGGWEEEGGRRGRVTAERSPLGSPDASPTEEEGVVCVCVREAGCTHTFTSVSLNARILLIQHSSPSSLPLLRSPALYGRARRSPSQLLNLILSWREAGEKESRGLAEK